MRMLQHHGIAGLHGRESIGAVLSIGRKETFGKKGNTEKFYIVNPREYEGKRELHPSFKAFNEAPDDFRKVIYGNIMHARRTDCYWYNLSLHTHGKMHPNRKYFCVGDGLRATRWVGPGPDDFKEIECPNDKCEFRLCNPKKCRPKSSWVFRLRWEGYWKDKNLPTPVIRFDNQSWNSCANIYGEQEITRPDGTKFIFRGGFFGQIEMAAEQMGIKDYSLFSYPFMMTLTRETKKINGVTWNYPVVTVTAEMDPISFFLQQRQNIKQIAAPMPVITIAAEIEEEPSVMYDHPVQVSIPAQIGKSEKPPIPRKKEEKTGKVSKNDSASQDGRPTALKSGEQNGEHKNYPEDWPSQNEKIIAKGDISFQGISNKTLGEFIAGKDAQKKEWAIYEGFYRLDRAKKKFTAKNAVKEFCKIIEDADGDISKLDASFLGAKLEALTKAASNLK